MKLDELKSTKTIKCSNPACELSFIIQATAKPCNESVYDFTAIYEGIGMKEIHGYSALCHCKKFTSFKRFASSFERKAKAIASPTQSDLLKELRRLQRELNSPRLMTYILGDTSEEEKSRKQEHASKLARFHEILNTLNGVTQ